MFTRVLTALAAVVLLAFAATPAQARWLRAESPRFIVYSDGSENELRAYVDKMELFDTFLRARHGLAETGVPLRKLPIYLVRDRDDLQETWNQAGDAIAGYYSPGTADVFAVATLEDRDDDSTLLHEYTHHFMLQNFPGAYPAWMVEGYAEYYGQTRIDAKFIEVGRVAESRGDDVLAGKWMSMADLLAGKRTGTNWGSFYAQSWLLTHYLMSDPDRYKSFQAYAAAVAKGADPVKAMTEATGQTPEALEQTLRRYARSGLKITQYNRGAFAKAPMTVTVMPPSADDLLLQRIQIVSHHYKEANAGYLPMIRRRAAKYPDDQLAVLTLAQTEMELGDPAKGVALMEAWLKTHPDDTEAMFVLGVHLYNSAFEEEEEEPEEKKPEKGAKPAEPAPAKPPVLKDPALLVEAEGWLKKAVALAPNDYKLLYAYAEARRRTPGYPTTADRDLLIRGYKQAPQVVALRFELIQALMAHRNYREARALLGPLVNSPHGGALVDQARALLKRIDEAEKGK